MAALAPRICTGYVTPDGEHHECGRDLSDRHKNAARCEDCQMARRSTRNRKANTNPEKLSRLPNGSCGVCFGMPWARCPGRLTDSGKAVAMGWRCRGCGELYAPERVENTRPLISSSAGTTARHGTEHGYDGMKPANANGGGPPSPWRRRCAGYDTDTGNVACGGKVRRGKRCAPCSVQQEHWRRRRQSAQAAARKEAGNGS